MSESVHKRSFLEVYASEDEERADVDVLQEEFDSESADNTGMVRNPETQNPDRVKIPTGQNP